MKLTWFTNRLSCRDQSLPSFQAPRLCSVLKLLYILKVSVFFCRLVKKMYIKIIIEFVLRMISRIIKLHVCVICLNLWLRQIIDNLWYHAQLKPIIAQYCKLVDATLKICKPGALRKVSVYGRKNMYWTGFDESNFNIR